MYMAVKRLMTKKGTVYINEPPSEVKTRNEAKKEAHELEKIANKSSHVIYQVSSVFPFQLFPDRIIIDENKVTIIRKELFFKRLYSIMYEDLITVRVNRGIIFAALEFEVKRIEVHLRPVTYLNPSKATEAKRYIMGLIEAKKAGLDLSQLNERAIRLKLLEIGNTQEEVDSLF